jgi:Putative zinc-finger
MERTFTCAEFEMLLADWIDGTLAASPESDAFLRHMESCPSCAEMAEDARFATGFMQRAADVEVPAALVSKILHATNSGWEFKLRGKGISGWINRTFAPVLKPRFVMGAMLTLMSMTIMARGCGFGSPEKFTAADLDPVRLWTALDNRAHRTWDHAVKSYESMRLVYEVRTQINDWTQQQKQEEEAAADARADKRKLESPKQQPGTGAPASGSENRKQP